MTIDDCVKELLINKVDDTYVLTNETTDFAIETMRKYQKIAQIAFPLQFCSTDKLEHEAIMKICEVIEDERTE